jgi:hypothetical protein
MTFDYSDNAIAKLAGAMEGPRTAESTGEILRNKIAERARGTAAEMPADQNTLSSKIPSQRQCPG